MMSRGTHAMPADVSVIIPTYNRAHLLPRTIDSVLGQTHPGCHVILVDDGSTDGTEAAVRDRYGGSPRVRVLRQENRGVSAARNAGLAAATGEYVAFLDSDDVWRPWKVEVQVACLERLRAHGVGMLWSDMDLADERGAVTVPNANRSQYAAYGLFPMDEMFSSSAALEELAPGVAAHAPGARVHWGDVYRCIALGNLCPTPSVILTRERAREVGGFDESLRTGEDHAYHLRTCALGPAAFLDVATFTYRKGAGDQLTAPAHRLAIAESSLRTIEDALARDGARLALPPALVARKLARAHASIGALRVDAGQHASARRHLLDGLRRDPRQ
ncbi:MAG TPA: glycosyltransferase, partial [Polyangia bacterium]|nr:glycosyltransferase [Polyangia bacterium]